MDNFFASTVGTILQQQMPKPNQLSPQLEHKLLTFLKLASKEHKIPSFIEIQLLVTKSMFNISQERWQNAKSNYHYVGSPGIVEFDRRELEQYRRHVSNQLDYSNHLKQCLIINKAQRQLIQRRVKVTVETQKKCEQMLKAAREEARVLREKAQNEATNLLQVARKQRIVAEKIWADIEQNLRFFQKQRRAATEAYMTAEAERKEAESGRLEVEKLKKKLNQQLKALEKKDIAAQEGLNHIAAEVKNTDKLLNEAKNLNSQLKRVLSVSRQKKQLSLEFESGNEYLHKVNKSRVLRIKGEKNKKG